MSTADPTPAYARAIRELAEQHRNTDTELLCQIWLVRCSMTSETQSLLRPVHKAAAKRIWSKWFDQPDIASCVQSMLEQGRPDSKFTYGVRRMNEAARWLLSHNSDPAVQARVRYYAAKELALDRHRRPTDDDEEQAKTWLRELIRDYAAIPEWQHGTMGEAAERHLFELEHLQPGMPAPQTVGTTLQDEPEALSDFKGKVVLLQFAGGMYHDAKWLAKLQREFSNDLMVIHVMEETAQDAPATVQANGIEGRVWVDGKRRGPVTSLWNVDSWTTTVVIDQNGTIRHTHAEGHALRDIIWRLIHRQG